MLPSSDFESDASAIPPFLHMQLKLPEQNNQAIISITWYTEKSKNFFTKWETENDEKGDDRDASQK